ncbi:MAG: DUF465 domain-containing protein [Pseudomonadota bacterium]
MSGEDDVSPAALSVIDGASDIDKAVFSPEKPPEIGANDEALRIRLGTLEEEHRDLDMAIGALQDQAVRQSLTIARLKKKKLQIKDQMTRLRDQIEPDIIA